MTLVPLETLFQREGSGQGEAWPRGRQEPLRQASGRGQARLEPAKGAPDAGERLSLMAKPDRLLRRYARVSGSRRRWRREASDRRHATAGCGARRDAGRERQSCALSGARRRLRLSDDGRSGRSQTRPIGTPFRVRTDRRRRRKAFAIPTRNSSYWAMRSSASALSRPMISAPSLRVPEFHIYS